MGPARNEDRGLDSALRKAGMDETPPDARLRLRRFLDEVALWSKRIHLVGKGGMPRNLGLLLLDSLFLLKAAEEEMSELGETRALRVADIGSGAGFPGVVWKVVRPRLEISLFERRTKAALFLARVISLLDLEGIGVVDEDASRFKGALDFDLAVSKAAGRLEDVLPLATKLLVPGGAYVTVKGRTWESEVSRPKPGPMRLVSSRELPERRGFALVFRKERNP